MPAPELMCMEWVRRVGWMVGMAVVGFAVVAPCAGAPIAGDLLGVRNGSMATGGAAPSSWSCSGDARRLHSGSGWAVRLASDGQVDATCVQSIRYTEPREGGFAVSCRVLLEQAPVGGDCCLWLDVLQDGGPPIWGAQGLPDRGRRGWQEVTAEVRPSHRVREVQVYLLMRKARGVALFSDVRSTPLPVRLRSFRAARCDDGRVEVRAQLTERADWLVRLPGGVAIRGVGADVVVPPSVSAGSRVTLAAAGQRWTAQVVRSPETGAPAVWVADSLERVFEDDLPPAAAAPRVHLDVARGESESAQVCLRSGGDALQDVRVRGEPPVARLGRLAVDLRRVGYVRVDQPFGRPGAERSSACWWPDPLLPMPAAMDVQPLTTQPIWVTVTAPPDAAPGRYRGAVRVVVGSRTVTVPLDIDVHDVVVPVHHSMKTAFALMEGLLRRTYGVVTPAMRRRYTDCMLDYRLNPDDISRTSTPDLGELEHADARGLNAFNILNVVPEPTHGEEWVCYADLSAYTPAFKETFLARLAAVVPELERRGLLDRAYVYGFDERGPEYLPVITDLFGAIKQRWPRIHTLSTAWPPPGTDPLSLNIDWFVPLSSSYDPAMARSVRLRGGEMWWYVCMGPRHPYANWLIEDPLVEARAFWWQAAQEDVEGVLYWGVNIRTRDGNGAPIPDGVGPHVDWNVSTGGNYQWLNGDGLLVYPGVGGPIPSMRLAAIRDGIEDTELLARMRRRFGVRGTAQRIRDVTIDRTHFAREPGPLRKTRLSILRLLSAGGSYRSP